MDRLSLLVWFQSKDGQDGNNRPAMMVDALMGKTNDNESDIESFESVEEFERLKKELAGD